MSSRPTAGSTGTRGARSPSPSTYATIWSTFAESAASGPSRISRSARLTVSGHGAGEASVTRSGKGDEPPLDARACASGEDDAGGPRGSEARSDSPRQPFQLAFASLHKGLPKLLAEDLAAERVQFGFLLVDEARIFGSNPLDVGPRVIEHPLDGVVAGDDHRFDPDRSVR